MFCDLYGACLIERRYSDLQIAVTTVLFPTWDAVPRTIIDMILRWTDWVIISHDLIFSISVINGFDLIPDSKKALITKREMV